MVDDRMIDVAVTLPGAITLGPSQNGARMRLTCLAWNSFSTPRWQLPYSSSPVWALISEPCAKLRQDPACPQRFDPDADDGRGHSHDGVACSGSHGGGSGQPAELPEVDAGLKSSSCCAPSIDDQNHLKP